MNERTLQGVLIDRYIIGESLSIEGFLSEIYADTCVIQQK